MRHNEERFCIAAPADGGSGSCKNHLRSQEVFFNGPSYLMN